MSDTFTKADRDAANEAFDIAFRGETDGIDIAMAKLFATHRTNSYEPMLAALEDVMVWVRNWDLPFEDDPEWADDTRPKIEAAIALAKGAAS